MSKARVFAELWLFLRQEKKYWLTPIVLVLVLFGLLMEHAGFIPALIVLIFGSAAAGTEFKPLEVLLLAVGLTAFCVVLFIWGLGLPYPLLVGW